MSQGLSDSLKKNEILALPREGQMLAIAIWTAERIEEYSPLPFPQEPREMEDYFKLDRLRRKKVDANFWKQPEVEIYMAQRNKVYVHNMSCLYHLKECLAVLNDEGHIDRIVIEKMLDKFFETKMYHNNRIKELLSEAEDGQFVRAETPKLAKEIRWDE